MTRLPALLLLSTALAVSARADEGADKALVRTEAVLRTLLLTNQPGMDGLVTVWDGNKYVQCRLLGDRSLRCEAAGTVMQPSLAAVVTPERQQRLAALGWQIDDSFGNYARSVPAGQPPGRTARLLLETLVEGYGAVLANLEYKNSWVASEPCPPRNGFSQNLAGMISDAPEMSRFSVHACRYEPTAPSAPVPLADDRPIGTAAEAIRLYGAKVTTELDRVLNGSGKEWRFMILDAGTGYVQCENTALPGELNCEAASANSLPELAPILTPDRVAQLHKAGFADPGRTQNYARSFEPGEANSAAVTVTLLTVLHYTYGFSGTKSLMLQTEAGGGRRPL